MVVAAMLAAGMLAALPGTASAGFTLTYDGNLFGSNSETGATAAVGFQFEDASPPEGRSLLKLAISNTTDIDLGSRLSAFGFDTPNDDFSVTFVEGTYSLVDADYTTPVNDEALSQLILNVQYANHGKLEISIQGNGNANNPSGGNGIYAGQTVYAVLELDTVPAVTSEELSAAFELGFGEEVKSLARFQGIGPNDLSDWVNGGIVDVTPPGGPPSEAIPEPGTAVLWLGMLGMMGAYGYRRHTRKVV